jgi:hypothetical protein
MSPTQCAQFERMLQEQADDQPSAAAVAHMSDCAACHTLWGDLQAIRTAGLEWGSEEVAPPGRLWTSLRLQLESEGLIREKGSGRGWFSAWFGVTPRWAVAGASVSLLLIAALLANYHDARVSEVNESNAALILPARFVSARDMSPKIVASDLEKTLDSDLQRAFASLPERNPLLASSLRQNLGIVDNLIAVCEKSVREEPNDEMVREYLYGAYEQKAVLLATATDRSASEGQ